MSKHWPVLFILLFLFWIVISGEADVQHLIAGAFISLISVLFWRVLTPRLPAFPLSGELLRLLYSIVLLAGYVVTSNIAVAKTLLFSKPPVSPAFVTMDTGIKSSWGKIFLAACITITPGTLTVDLNPDTGTFIVHTLTEENAVDLHYWRIIDKIKALETWRGGEVEHDLDISGHNVANTSGIAEGHHRADNY